MDGLFYKPFLKFILKEFKLKGSVVSPMIVTEIIKELEVANFVIASVSSEIRDPSSKPIKVGGHLVLVAGYDWDKKILYISNPSFSQKRQMPMQISLADFSKFFANRGIIIGRN